MLLFLTSNHPFMITLFRKELISFLGSIIGYMVFCVFLATMGLFLWIFPNEMNVFESGYASLQSLFFLAPWILMFLIPAVTMRSFADEKKLGTIELLLTKPLSDAQIVLSKFLASLSLVVIAILPTVVYYYSVYQLGNPIGNIDSGAFWGSFVGLIFLSSAYCAIGIFASSISENQIVSFILALFLCFFWYIGFSSISSLNWLGPIDHLLINLGMEEHFTSLGRGVIDSRDVLYFLSVATLFLIFSTTKLGSRRW